MSFQRLFLALAFAALIAPSANAQDVGRVMPASLPVPLPSPAPVPPNVLRAKNPWYMSVTGTWKFALTHGKIVAGQYQSEEVDSGPITDSSNEDLNVARNAFDGDTTTRWCADGDDFPQWLQADLGKPEQITGVNLTWERSGEHYQCKVEGSLDRKAWTVLADETAAPGIGDGPVTITPGSYRYVRLTVTGATGMSWASVYECQIHYSNGGQDVVWQAPPVAPVDNSEAALDAFTTPGFDDTAWDNIPVPSNWEMLGYSLPTYGSVDNTVGQYRRYVDVPASWTGKKIYWRFDGALDGAELWVNGQKAGYHESGYTAFDVDVTGLIHPGQKNLLAARVSKTTPSDDCETGDFQCMGGIFRETALIAVPQTHVSDIFVQTPLSADYKDATLNATVTVQTDPGAAVKLDGKLVNIAGVPAGSPVAGAAVAGPDGLASVVMSMPVKAPALWSAEKPNLYYLVMQLSDGSDQPVERVEQRFGFKQIDIKNNVVLWNGVPIKCTGTCRHDFWADKGFALTDAQWIKDLDLMKAANINAIRTSHYNHAERFLELCEEKGMYILDEVPYCWINDQVKDPAYEPYLIQRATETLARDKDRPCVLAWSIGNENPYGQDSQDVFDYVKKTDPTRPAFVSCLSPSDIKGQDWQDGHYPAPWDIDSAANQNASKWPTNYSENPHIFYQKETQDYDPGASDLWSEALGGVWDKIWNAPTILGSFIWEWQNQGIADQNANTTRDFWYGPDQLRDENNKGIVDAYRNPKQEWWIVKQVYSPVHVGVRTISPSAGTFTIPITNRYSFTDLGELTTKWIAFNGSKLLQSGTEHLACPPLQSVQASFPAPRGTTMLRLDFDHPDGSSVIAVNLAVDGAPVPMAPGALPAGNVLTAKDSADTLTVANGLETIVFDKHAGTIQSWQVHGRSVLVGGPELNFGELKASTEKNAYETTMPPVTQNATVTAAPADASGAVTVSVTSDVLSEPAGTDLGTFTSTYDIQPDAEITVNWNMNWTAPDISLWEEGLKFSVPSTLNKMAWYRDSFFTDYPMGHIGEPLGTASATDVSFRASKRNLHWLTLTDSSSDGVALLPYESSPLVGRAGVGQTGNVLFASSGVAGPWDFSGVWVKDHDINAGKGKPIGGAFILRAIGS